jgi:hypothetical protein
MARRLDSPYRTARKEKELVDSTIHRWVTQAQGADCGLFRRSFSCIQHTGASNGTSSFPYRLTASPSRDRPLQTTFLPMS